MRIAVIGSGISGLGAAWALHRVHDVTVFEAADRLGGHANTVDVDFLEGPVSVDTGFIVYNEVTYPHLTSLFAHLDVATEPSDMSFAFSLDRDFEYGASARGVLAQPANLVRPRFRRMLTDINRFRRVGTNLDPAPGESIGELLARHGFTEGFRDDYLLPMIGAIWSARTRHAADYPAESILHFLSNHGLIEIVGRPRWRTVTGGSRSYVQKLAAPLARRLRLNSPVSEVVRTADSTVVRSAHSDESFDHVVFATHSDQALRILGQGATPQERELLGAIRYEPNEAVLHGDADLMPRRRGTWSSWNAMARSADRFERVAAVTYWMNRLQNLNSRRSLFVSLNPLSEPEPTLVHGRYSYSHPQFDARAVAAQQGIAAIQGKHNTWFAGAYLGYGFHEDGLQSGLNVAAALGSPPPWYHSVVPMSSAPAAVPLVATR